MFVDKMSYLSSPFKCLVIVLLLPTVSIAQTSDTAASISVPTTVVTNATTELPLPPPPQYGTIINSLCDISKCNCPTTPTEGIEVTTINCDSLDLVLMPQWNSSADPQVNSCLSISFENNKIQKINPINATNNFIQSISFRGNRINEISEFAFENLTNLKSLSLAENLLEKIDHRIFRTTSSKNLPLEVLDLSYNTIVHIDDDAFEQLENLKELILSYNPIHALDSSTTVSLNSMHKLEKLELRHTKLRDLPINELINPMRNLKELDISYNLFTSVPETLQSATELEKLNLDGNNITELTAISFISLISLEELYINNMENLTGIYDGTFTPMVKLLKLSCNNNTKLKKISTQAFINHFGEGPKDLKLLLLNNNSLATINRETFVHMNEAKMEFKDNKLYCSCSLKWMQSEHGDLRCSTPASLNSRQLKDVDFDNVPCETDKTINTSHIGLVLGISIVVMALVGSIIFIIMRKRQVTGYPNAHYSRAKENDGCDLNDDI